MDTEYQLTSKGKKALYQLAEDLRLGIRSPKSVSDDEKVLLIFLTQACADAGLKVGTLRTPEEVDDFIKGPYTQLVALVDEQTEMYKPLIN